jgi:hypothetical protein
MLRLDFSAEPVWIDLVDGVRVLVQPFTSVIWARAQAIARRALAPLPAASDEAVQEHFERLSAAVACAAITAWEGVGDAEGAPLAISSDAIAGLMSIPACSEAFKIGYMVKVVEILAEKKGFAPSLNGTSGAERVIVVPAPRPADTVHMS